MKNLLLTLLLLLSAVLTAASTGAAQAELVKIQSVHNGKYAAFRNGYLAAGANQTNGASFELVRLGDNRVAFRDPASGRYLSNRVQS